MGEGKRVGKDGRPVELWHRAGTVRELYETKGGELKFRDVPAFLGNRGGRMSRHAARVLSESSGFRAVFVRPLRGGCGESGHYRAAEAAYGGE